MDKKPIRTQFFELMSTDATVKVFYEHWRHGGFISFEECMMALVLSKSEQVGKMSAQLSDLLTKSSTLQLHVSTPLKVAPDVKIDAHSVKSLKPDDSGVSCFTFKPGIYDEIYQIMSQEYAKRVSAYADRVDAERADKALNGDDDPQPDHVVDAPKWKPGREFI